MPDRALRPCRHAGCAGLSSNGWCDRHTTDAKDQRAEKERWRGSAASRGYDYAWTKVRDQALKRDCYLCQMCLKAVRITAAVDVDHIVPFVSLDDPLRLDVDNTQSLCRACHNTKTAAKKRKP